jgi:hypothetical protein
MVKTILTELVNELLIVILALAASLDCIIFKYSASRLC